MPHLPTGVIDGCRTSRIPPRRLGQLLRALLVTALLTAGTVMIIPTPASADAPFTAVLYWVRCQDESEPGSDEPYIIVNGQQVAQATNVDPGDHIWFLGQNQFTFEDGWLTVELWEDDGFWR